MGKAFREASELGSMLTRMARALVRRAEVGDVDALAALVAAGAELRRAEGEAARALNAAGMSWSEIGAELGITKQAAQRKWGQDK